MNEKELQQLREHIEAVIEQKVNGKIDRMEDKLDRHMLEIQPFLEGYRGARVIGNVLKWIAGVVIAVGGTIAVFKL